MCQNLFLDGSAKMSKIESQKIDILHFTLLFYIVKERSGLAAMDTGGHTGLKKCYCNTMVV